MSHPLHLTNRWSQPLTAVMSIFDFMKHLSLIAALALVYPPRGPAVAQLRLVRPLGTVNTVIEIHDSRVTEASNPSLSAPSN